MTQTAGRTAAPSTDWLGFDCPYPQPVPRAVASTVAPKTANLTGLLDPFGESVEREPTELRIWRDEKALHVHARCVTAALDRVREIIARATPYARDEWGDDALELQIDVGCTRREYRHIILPPNGLPVTYLGYDNRHVQGWHPQFDFRTWLEDDGWCVEVTLPFAMLGATPGDDDVWGLNVMRVNASEPRGYVQWAPTFGDALRPSLFGKLHFSGQPSDRQADTAAYAKRAADRKADFLATINNITEADALRELGVSDWQAWAQHMQSRPGPISLRWEGTTPGKEGILASEHKLIIAEADAMVDRIATWTVDQPSKDAFGIGPLEALGEAWLLTEDAKYARAFDAAMAVHAALMRDILATVTDPHQLHYSTNPYHDIQVVNTAIVAHAYILLSKAGLAPQTHAVMMWTVLRAGRFASHNIRTAYNAGNHQAYESGGLAAVAAYFPEMPESDEWAAVASRSIRLHLEQEVGPDGAYFERCGYHSVALSFTMHAVAIVRLNGAEHRFADLMCESTLSTMERMYEWMLWMLAPDGTFPAFGDCGQASYLPFLERGAAIFNRGDLAWPMQQLEPAMVPAGVTPREPAKLSVSLDSQFTVMRDGWTPQNLYMSVDHGPLGGQHSHPDTLGFVAYAHGKPVALDSGISLSYEDKRYIHWFRKVRAHNTIAIDDLETEKVAQQVAFRPGRDMDVLVMRSLGYQHRLGVTHHRTIHFIKGVGWFINDHLAAADPQALAGRAVDWLFHTPYALQPHSPSRLDARLDDTGLLVVLGDADRYESPHISLKPSAVPCPAGRTMRLWDLGRRLGSELTREITQLSLRHKPLPAATRDFAVLLLPYRTHRPDVTLTRHDRGWTLQLAPGQSFDLPDQPLD